MLYGASRTLATPGAKDTCAVCGSALVAKCGSAVVWHWAHASTRDCDSWYEGTTDWHLAWQSAVTPERREVVLGRHRADMVLSNGLICEVQHSNIDAMQIRERESFYKNMIWIVDAQAANLKGNFEAGRPWRFGKHEYVSIWWKYRKKAAWAFQRRVYIDAGDALYLFEGFHDGKYHTDKFKFRARKIQFEDFIRSLKRPNRKTGSSMIAYYDREQERVRWRAE